MQKLLKIQTELKAPKNLFNNFGKYKYRNLEGILEAVKPLLAKHNCLLLMSDDVIEVGGRVYVKATATINDIETSEQVSISAVARESAEKKGMDDSQITGTASSYARKYALNGLFLIDDTKDADTDEYHNTTKEPSVEYATETEKKIFKELCAKQGLDLAKVLKQAGHTGTKMTAETYGKAMIIVKENDMSER